MRVGFDAKRLFNNFTGLGNYSRFVVSALSEYYPNNEYWLYTPDLRNHSEINGILKKKSISLHPPSSLTTSLRLGSFWRSYHLGNVAAHDSVQLFHGLSNELPITKPRSLKTIVTVHDVIFKRFPQLYKPIDRQIYTWKLNNACRTADKIIAISKQTADDLVEFLKIDPAKIEVVYQGCHANFKRTYSKDQLKEVQTKYKLPKEFILNVGTIESRKNVLLLLQALKSSANDLPVLIVGRATSYMKQLTDYITANGLERRVTFILNVDFSDLSAIYQLAKVFVYPSLFEGFGIPIVEAISCGVPVITSQGSCFEEAGGPDCLYVDSKNQEQLAVALNKVLSNDGLATQMTAKSKTYIEKFEPSVIAAELMRIYKGILQ
ncbi:MAG: glycosyltransferase family 1 protein [Bacteroidota bacterium]